jgi:hypothetical protein
MFKKTNGNGERDRDETEREAMVWYAGAEI